MSCGSPPFVLPFGQGVFPAPKTEANRASSRCCVLARYYQLHKVCWLGWPQQEGMYLRSSAFSPLFAAEYNQAKETHSGVKQGLLSRA
jgi:hypothetical protein